MIEVQRFEVVGAGDIAAVVTLLVEGLGLFVEHDADVTRVGLDTADGALGAADSTLEHRLATDGSASLVWLVEGRTVARIDDVARDVPGAAEGTALPARVLDIVGDAPFVATDPVTSRVVGLLRTDDEDKTTVRVVLDRTIGADGSTLPILLEVVPLRGYEREARRLVRRLGDAVALRPTTTASADRVRPARSAPSGLSASMSAGEGWRTVLRSLTAVMTTRFSGVLSGDDPEDLHAFRVAVRRIRTLLRDGEDVLAPAERERFRSDFHWLGDVTTPARDADVHVLDHPGFVEMLAADRRDDLAPLLDVLLAHRDDAHRALTRELRSGRRAEFGTAWANWLDDDERWTPTLVARSADPITVVAVAAVRDAHRRLVKDGRSVRKSSPAVVLHDLRKDAKRLRYLLECFAPVFDPDAVDTITAPLRTLQDVLGTFQDAAVQAAALERLVSGGEVDDPATLLAVGIIVDDLDRSSAKARRALAKTFSRFDDRKVRRAFDDLDCDTRSRAKDGAKDGAKGMATRRVKGRTR